MVLLTPPEGPLPAESEPFLAAYMDAAVVRAPWDDALVTVTNHPLALTAALNHPKLQRFAPRVLEILDLARGSLLQARAAQLVRIVATTSFPKALQALLKPKPPPVPALLQSVITAAEEVAAAEPEALLALPTEAIQAAAAKDPGMSQRGKALHSRKVLLQHNNSATLHDSARGGDDEAAWKPSALEGVRIPREELLGGWDDLPVAVARGSYPSAAEWAETMSRLVWRDFIAPVREAVEAMSG